MDFNTTLLREKFIIRDVINAPSDSALIAMSNRMAVNLTDAKGITVETIIVRAQNMHLCIRMASHIVHAYEQNGSLLYHDHSYSWEKAWERLIGTHEQKHNPHKWIALYAQGKVVFESGIHHPFLDLIEKCDAANPENYDSAVRLAEDAFSQLGKTVTVDYESNIGLVVFVEKGQGRCGIILRNASDKNSTFNFRIEESKDQHISPVQCLNICAAFLEGIQLAFIIGMANEKMRLTLISKSNTEYVTSISARRRLGKLNTEIRAFENSKSVHYRPQRPEFGDLVSHAEKLARDLFSQIPPENYDENEEYVE